MNNDHQCEKEKIKICDECRSKLARKITKAIAERMHSIIFEEYKKTPFDDDSGLFQAEVYQLLSSYYLSHTIKILNILGLSWTIIDLMCDNAILAAKEFAEKGDFKKMQSH